MAYAKCLNIYGLTRHVIWPNKKTCILVIVIILSFSYSEFILETNLRFLLVLTVFLNGL